MIYVYDLNGRIVQSILSETLDKMVMDVLGLNKGQYIIQIKHFGNIIASGKLTIH